MLKKSRAKKRTSGKTTEISKFIWMQVYALIIYIILFVLFSIICLLTDLSIGYIYYVSLIMILISSFLVGFISGIKSRQNGLLIGVLNALPVNLLYILISLIFNSFKADFNIIITTVVAVVAAAVGGIVSVNMKVRK